MQETPNQTTNNDFKPLDFSLVKESFSLSRFCRDEGISLKKGAKGGKVCCCPFHIEDTPSCHIFDDRRYTCFGCGAKGTIIDFVLKMKPDLGSSQWAAAVYLIETQGTGRKDDYSKGGSLNSSGNLRNVQSNPRPVYATATAPAVHSLKVDKSKVLANSADTVTAIGDQIFNPRFSRAHEYAEKRGWISTPPHVSSYQLGAMAAGEGSSFLSREVAVAFPKLIQTRRTAEVFGLEKEFDENDRVLCAGIKKRLLPETISKWEKMQAHQGNAKGSVPRWICKAGFITEIPWEFDCNEDADVLIIAEGPGDGLRLFNEANATTDISSQWGLRWHVTAVDSCHIWTVNSIPRRPVSWGSQNFSVSFFDGFKHVIILLDGDAPGRKGAENIIELARRQNPSAIVRDVVLPGEQDVNDFFDSGNKMSDLAELFRATQPVK